jgi:ribosomal protein S7
MKKKINLKKKLSNRLLINGKKKIVKILLKSFKYLQKESKKTKKVFQLAIINTHQRLKYILNK